MTPEEIDAMELLYAPMIGIPAPLRSVALGLGMFLLGSLIGGCVANPSGWGKAGTAAFQDALSSVVEVW